MLIENTRNMMNSVRKLMEIKYKDIIPLKYVKNSYITGQTYLFEKKLKKITLNYSLSFNSSKDMLSLITSDINYKNKMKTYDKDAYKNKFLMSFKAYSQKGKIFSDAEEEVNITVAEIIKSFSENKTYLPNLLILSPVAEEKYLDIDLINKKLSEKWTLEKYLDENDSIVYLFMKIE